jgi:anti-sigma regulatory factor (Ser/Thr protein kinase)
MPADADIDIRLAPDARAPEAARRSLEALCASVGRKVVEEATLLVSELVTNSVRHGDLDGEDTIGVRAAATPRGLRVEVSDPGSGFDAAEVPEPNGRGGWGLWLMDRLATRWGVSRENGIRVWFELGTVSAERGPGT